MVGHLPGLETAMEHYWLENLMKATVLSGSTFILKPHLMSYLFSF